MKQYDPSKVRVFVGDVELRGVTSDAAIEVCAEALRQPRSEPTGREDAERRLAAVVAELERLEPGCTRLRCGTAFVEPADRNLRQALGVEVASDSCRYFIAEVGFAWAAPALTMGGCPVPKGEAPADTARRLLAEARRS